MRALKSFLALGIFSLLLIFSCKKKLELNSDNSIKSIQVFENNINISNKVVSATIDTLADANGNYAINIVLKAGIQIGNIV